MLQGPAVVCASHSHPQGYDSLKTIGIDNYPSPSPMAYRLTSVGTMALIETGGDCKRISSAWLTLLLSPGSVVMKSGDKPLGGLVMYTTQFGCMLAVLRRIVLKPPSGEKIVVYIVSEAQDASFRFAMVEDPSVWKAAAAKPVPPILLQHMCRGLSPTELPTGIVIMLDAPPNALLKFAARQSFRSMSLVHLRKLAKMLLVGRSGLDTWPEKRLLTALVQYLLQDSSENEVNAIVAARTKIPEPEVSLLTQLVEDDLVEGLFERDDAHEIKLHAKKIIARKKADDLQKKKTTSATAPSAGCTETGGACSSSHVGKRTPVQSAPPTGGLSSSEAQQFKPQVVGCSLYKDTALHMRWSARYPREEPPYSCTKAWTTTGLTDRQAMCFCLRWLWDRHKEATGEECPHELAD